MPDEKELLPAQAVDTEAEITEAEDTEAVDTKPETEDIDPDDDIPDYSSIDPAAAVEPQHFDLANLLWVPAAFVYFILLALLSGAPFMAGIDSYLNTLDPNGSIIARLMVSLLLGWATQRLLRRLPRFGGVEK